MIKVLITGSNGLLGQTLLKQLLDTRCHVIAVSKGKNRFPREVGYHYFGIDITNTNLLLSTIRAVKPHFIINAAAITNVDFCEDNKELCDAVNVDAVKHLVAVTKELNAHLIHISTDFIFDGIKGNYKETDTPNPVNYYGKSKLLAEEAIVSSTIDYTILRTILVFGKVAKMNKGNLVLWLKEKLEDKDEVTIVDDQYRMPTYVEELARACLLSMQEEAKGIFNISSNKLLSIYEMAQQIAEVFELDKNLIKPISTATLNQRAKRPPKTGFNLDKSIKELGFKPKSFKENLQKFKEKLI